MNKEKLILLKPDKVISGGHINDQDSEILVNQSSGKIVAIGTEEYIRGLTGAENNIDKIKGGIVTPAICDAHDHVVADAVSLVLKDLPLHGIEKKEAILRKIGDEHKQKIEAGYEGYLIARGFDSRIPLTIDDLDKAAPTLPLLVLDPSNHSGVANSKALDAMVAKLETLDHLPDGEFYSDGRLTDGYASIVKSLAAKAVSAEQFTEALEAVLLARLAAGTSYVHDMGVRTAKELTSIAGLKKRWQKKYGAPFPITRAYVFPNLLTPDPVKEIKNLVMTGVLHKDDLDWIGIKLFIDGALGSRSAYLGQDYSDQPGKRGQLLLKVDEASLILKKAAESGIDQVAVHAIGDAAIQESLLIANVWRKLAEEKHLDPTKFRLEHFELPLPTDEVLKEVVNLDIWVGLQPDFLTDYIYHDRLGKRVEVITPHRLIHEQGLKTTYGTDRMPASPLFAIWCAIQALYPSQKKTF